MSGELQIRCLNNTDCYDIRMTTRLPNGGYYAEWQFPFLFSSCVSLAAHERI
jgi:hypothetical protein